MAKRKRTEDEAADSSMMSSEKGPYDYEVFLSFRGEDTRKGFTSHLYKELQDRGIKAFIDCEDLQKGEKISELLKHIDRSKIFVPIFSEKYADSKWCLMEIAKMVKIADAAEGKRPIIPVFFDVSPSDVRNQTGSFGDGFKKHKSNEELDVNEWRKALERAGESSGYCLNDTKGTEAELITEICQKVSDLLSKVLFDIKPIGIDSRTNQVMEMLERETDGVCVIGIYGPGGIGKTTIAQDVCNRLSLSYDGSTCFIPNVRESAKHHKGLPELQTQLIKDVLREHKPLNTVEEGISFIQRRMRSKKVLLILDDVDDKKQLDAFIAHRKDLNQEEWFGAGSKIIVTTRDKDVLLKHGLKEDQIYALKELNYEHSLQLFRRHAFQNDEPKAEFIDLSKEVVEVTGGLPLALKVLGSLFYGISDKKQWQELLTKLKLVQDKDILERLKISYDSLEQWEKCIFLDIACFFVGKRKQFPVYMWEDCRYFPSVSLKALEHKSLISIDYYGRFIMHDQIRDMGRTIVRDEGDLDPLKYSRLWDGDDIKKVLEEAEEFELPLIQGMTFRNMGNGHKHLSKEASEAMTSLKILDNINYGDEDDGPIHLPRNLKYLSLNYGRSDTVRSHNDRLNGLVVLDLSGGSFREIAMGNMVLPRLKVLDLTGCEELVRIPDFTHLQCLERLVLDECLSLEEIDESIGRLKKLVFLSMEKCKKLKGLPNSLCELKLLQVLDLQGCVTISLLPEGLGDLKSLERLDLEGCWQLKGLPNSLCELKSLQDLVLKRCSGISLLPEGLGDLKSLERLNLEGCWQLKGLPNSLCELELLQVLVLRDCRRISLLQERLGYLKSLQQLDLDGCSGLRRLPDSLGGLILN